MAAKNNYILQAWLAILLGLLYGVGLAGIQVSLAGKIEKNKKNETFRVVPELVPGADVGKTEEKTVIGSLDKKEIRIYLAHDAQGKPLGWVIPASGQGFADKIELLAAISADLSTLTGIYILDQKETPGLGNYITDAELFRNGFAGLPADPAYPLTVVKTDPAPGKPEVRALTGATVSSVSVADIVNKAILNIKPALAPGNNP